MSGFDPGDYWFIQLGGSDDKKPRFKWGGYSQSFVDSDEVYTHDEVVGSEWSHWGVVGTQRQAQTTSMTTLIFDLDVHKSETPREFGNRIDVPEDTTIVKSQSGGFHVYFTVHGERGDLKESDFEMTRDVDWGIDIRGSAVSMHVAAPTTDGIDMDYEIVQDESAKAVIDPADAAERIQLDGEPLLKFSPGRSYSGGVEIDRDVEPPEEMPTCYHRGLQMRAANPDDHPNTHKVNVLTAMCGLAAGYSVDEMVAHFCDEFSPGPNADTDRTEYQLSHLADHIDRGDYSAPALSTLRDFGILDDDESCDCDIPYHGDSQRPALDVIKTQGNVSEAKASAEQEDGHADGGATVDTAAQTAEKDKDQLLLDDVTSAIAEAEAEEIPVKTARHRIAQSLNRHYNFVYPEDEVRGWRSALYVFNEEEGIYEPRGERFVKKILELVAGDFVTNQVTNEIVGKIKRMSSERGDAFKTNPERLVVGNGILDLHVGELDEYNPSEYHRTKIDVDWNPDAGEPDEIDVFLHDIVDDGDVITLYRLIAHSLYKEYVTEKAAMLIGSGQNGKSVFLELVEKFLGEYNVTHRELQAFEDDFKANALEGKLANVHPDMGDEDVKDLSMFKKLTGRDTMLADVKFEKPIQFENYATLIFAANELPRFAEDNHAVWRRWLYIDFPHTFDENDPDAKDPVPKRVLMRKLTSDGQMEALLYKCQQEIQAWYGGRQWFADAMAPDEVREQMKKAAEPIYNFAATCLEADEDSWLAKDEVRDAYGEYADQEGLPKFGNEQFGERLLSLTDFQIELGRPRQNGGRVNAYKGISWTSRGRQVAGLDENSDDQQANVDDVDDSRKLIVDTVKELFEANGHEPVKVDMVIGRASGKVGMATAERTLKKLRDEQKGVILPADGETVVPAK